jgi:hypothetical protein
MMQDVDVRTAWWTHIMSSENRKIDGLTLRW